MADKSCDDQVDKVSQVLLQEVCRKEQFGLLKSALVNEADFMVVFGIDEQTRKERMTLLSVRCQRDRRTRRDATFG